jgi:hypothetical protein
MIRCILHALKITLRNTHRVPSPVYHSISPRNSQLDKLVVFSSYSSKWPVLNVMNQFVITTMRYCAT